MTLRQLVKRVCPPALLDALRGRAFFPPAPLTWEGSYPTLSAVPGTRGSYDDDARIGEFVARARTARAQLAEGRPLAVTSVWHQGLALLAASLAGTRPDIRVLDVGGGVGIAYLHVLAALRGPTAIRYEVVDLEGMCAAGRALFADDPRIRFSTALPARAGDVDVVYACSVLPYVEDYAGLLRQLAALWAPYVLLDQLAAGPFPRYAARQLNLPGQTLPYWFLNLDEIVEIVTGTGYVLVYEGQLGPVYAQPNYPEASRLGRMRRLLFVRPPAR